MNMEIPQLDPHIQGAGLDLPKVEKRKEKRAGYDFSQAIGIARSRVEWKSSSTEEGKKKSSELKREAQKLSDYYKEQGVDDQEKTAMKEAAKRIFDLEMQRQEMELEKENALRALKNNGKTEWPFSGKRAVFDVRDNSFNIEGTRASWADLISSISWEGFYELGDDVPVQLREKYLKAAYEARLGNLRDRQLVDDRVYIIDALDKFKLRAYEEAMGNVAASSDKLIERGTGIVFERMISNLMRSVAEGITEAGLAVEKANVIQDVENKIDFVIKVHKNNRAVEVQETEDENYGIQCTLNRDPEKLKSKRDQVREVNLKIKHPEIAREALPDIDELLLVTVPIGNKEVSEIFAAWIKKGKPAGGPEKLFPADRKLWLVEQMLQGKEIMKDEGFRSKLKEYFRSEIAIK